MTWTHGRRFAEITGACSLALGQPVLDVFGRSTETFVFRGVDGRGLMLFGLLMTIGPAVAVWGLELVVTRAVPRRRELIEAATTGALTGLAALVAVRWFSDLTGVAASAAAAAVGVTAAALHHRRPVVRSFYRYLAVLPMVSFAGFVLFSPASALLDDGDVAIAESATDAPVVMLVLDEFPTAVLLDQSGDIDPGRFPNFAAFSEEAAWYRNYTTLNASTVRAVPTLLTGSTPERDDQPIWTDHPDNLFTLLGGSHAMRVRETVTQLCPPSLCSGTTDLTGSSPPGATGLLALIGDAVDVTGRLLDPRTEPRVALDAFEEQTVTLAPLASGAEGDGDVAVQPARFSAFVDDLVASDDPVLHFLHLILPHGPWKFTEDGTEYAPPRIDPPGLISGTWTDDWPASLTRLRLELQTRYTDRLLGEVIDRLRASRLWDTATIVVVADHGGSFIEGQRGRALSDANAHEVMWTPLFVRSPGLEPGRTDVNAQSVDVLPTIATLVDTPVDADIDGRPLVRRVGQRFLPGDGVAGDSGLKQYARFTNAFQPEADALLDIEVAPNFRRLLRDGVDVTAADAADPIGAFYRTTPHGDLYRRSVASLEIATPAPARLRLDRRAALEAGDTERPLPLYVGGALSGDTGDTGGAEDPWIAIAVDDRIVALSPLFAGAEDNRAFAALIAATDLGGNGDEVSAYLVGADNTLHPLTVR